MARAPQQMRRAEQPRRATRPAVTQQRTVRPPAQARTQPQNRNIVRQPQNQNRNVVRQPQDQNRNVVQQPQKQNRNVAQQPQVREQDRAQADARKLPLKGDAATVTQRATERHTRIRQAREQLAAPDRTRLQTTLRLNEVRRFNEARVRNVRFDRRVGHRIPRNLRLWAIPAAVVAFFPYYSGYSYFVVEEDLYVVDPQSYVVVDVVDSSYWTGGGGERQQMAGLQLTEEEIVAIRNGIPPDVADAGLRLRLALGATIPQFVELMEFPLELIDQIPKLRGYRFLVNGEQIVIVQPRDRSIAYVIDRT